LTNFHLCISEQFHKGCDRQLIAQVCIIPAVNGERCTTAKRLVNSSETTRATGGSMWTLQTINKVQTGTV